MRGKESYYAKFTWEREKGYLFMQTVIKIIGGQQEVNYILITQ